MSRKEKNQIKSIEDLSKQVLGLIAIIEDHINHYYEIIQQQIIEKAIEHYNGNNIDFNNSNDLLSKNIAIHLIDYIIIFYNHIVLIFIIIILFNLTYW